MTNNSIKEKEKIKVKVERIETFTIQKGNTKIILDWDEATEVKDELKRMTEDGFKTNQMNEIKEKEKIKRMIEDWQLKIFVNLQPVEMNHDKLWDRLNPLLEKFGLNAYKLGQKSIFRVLFRRLITEKFLVRRDIIELEKVKVIKE